MVRAFRTCRESGLCCLCCFESHGLRQDTGAGQKACACVAQPVGLFVHTVWVWCAGP